VSIEAADVVLKGRVTKYEVTPASYTADSYVQSYNVSIGVSLTFEDVRTGKVILQDQGLGTVFISGYAVTIGNISATKIAKDAAIKNASKNLASTVRSRVLEGF
jgi:curli biogenesis system outer membrane secretion channel CsgG